MSDLEAIERMNLFQLAAIGRETDLAEIIGDLVAEVRRARIERDDARAAGDHHYARAERLEVEVQRLRAEMVHLCGQSGIVEVHALRDEVERLREQRDALQRDVDRRRGLGRCRPLGRGRALGAARLARAVARRVRRVGGAAEVAMTRGELLQALERERQTALLLFSLAARLLRTAPDDLRAPVCSPHVRHESLSVEWRRTHGHEVTTHRLILWREGGEVVVVEGDRMPVHYLFDHGDDAARVCGLVLWPEVRAVREAMEVTS